VAVDDFGNSSANSGGSIQPEPAALEGSGQLRRLQVVEEGLAMSQKAKLVGAIVLVVIALALAIWSGIRSFGPQGREVGKRPELSLQRKRRCAREHRHLPRRLKVVRRAEKLSSGRLPSHLMVQFKRRWFRPLPSSPFVLPLFLSEEGKEGF